ncbi:MAG TPA: hypothetical protein VJ899_08870 [Salegentibacter sp.]|nr:hypothetical protein [Salegentibacter sp.]
MTKESSNWMKDPTTIQLILFTLFSSFGIVLLILVVTDLFTENPFKKQNLLLFFLALASAIATIKLHINYWKK